MKTSTKIRSAIRRRAAVHGPRAEQLEERVLTAGLLVMAATIAIAILAAAYAAV